MQCPKCQHENLSDAAFCEGCGTGLAPRCPTCQTDNRVTSSFCRKCGTPLTQHTSGFSLAQATQAQIHTESRFHAMLSAVMWCLQRDRRVTYRTLKHILGLDDVLLEEIRKELTFRQVAREEQGEGLVWTVVDASTPPATADTMAVISSPATPTLPSHVPETRIASQGPTAPVESIAIDTLPGEPAVIPEPTRSAPEAERRQLTVMFCDLPDSTPLAQQLDAEDLREVIRAYQATAAEVIHRFEGHIAQYLGDGLLVYFGWPIAHEDDAPRALHAGLGIVAAITTRLHPRLEREKGVQIAVRIGIHTGPVVVGEMGGGGRHEHLATGDTVNIASRLEGLAAPNTVVISPVTARLVRGAFALEELGKHPLKGVTEPMQVFRVLRPLEPHEDETMTASVPFLVGRDEEMGLMRRRWEQAKEGLGQVVLVSGTAGIGKSSLVEVLRAQVRGEGVPRIAFRCSSYHQHSALYPVITHMERLLDVQREDAPATRLDKLEQGLRPYNLPLDEVVPLFAGLLSVPLDDRYPAVTLTSPQQKQHTLDALVTWLFAEAEQQPVLVAWEDLHWADPSTLELLGLVLEQTPTVPMLHVLAFRPEFDVPWPTRSHVTPITLNRLERPQIEAMITHLAAGNALPAEVVQHIVAKTDGVPLYVEELTKMLLASDLLRREDGQYVLTGPLVSVAIPDTLHDSLMARLDQLHTAKEVAQLGAVLGREFAYELLHVVASQEEETLQTGLAQLVEAELLYQRGRLPRATYRFKHALIQDAAYTSLLKSTRQRVHQQIVQVLEERFPELVETQPELVAHHCTAAGQDEAALGYWQRAGQRALQRSAHAEAIAHLTQGLTVLTMLPTTPARLHQELDLQVALGPALFAMQGYAVPEVERAYARARELCAQIGDTPQLFPVLRGLILHYMVRGQLQEAHRLAEELLSLAQSRPEPAHRMLAHFMLGSVLFFHEEPAGSHAHHTQAMTMYDPQAHQALVLHYGLDISVVSRAYLALELWLLGYPDQAMQSIQEARRLAQQVSHPYSLCLALRKSHRVPRCLRRG